MNVNRYNNEFLISQNTHADLKGPKENIICTMDDVRGDFVGPPHGTTPAAVIGNEILPDVCSRSARSQRGVLFLFLEMDPIPEHLHLRAHVRVRGSVSSHLPARRV